MSIGSSSSQAVRLCRETRVWKPAASTHTASATVPSAACSREMQRHACRAPALDVRPLLRRELILPLARLLGIPTRNVMANRMQWQLDDDTGLPSKLAGFDPRQAVAHNRGKPAAIRELRRQHPYQNVVMIGDGITDLEAVQAPPTPQATACIRDSAPTCMWGTQHVPRSSMQGRATRACKCSDDQSTAQSGSEQFIHCCDTCMPTPIV